MEKKNVRFCSDGSGILWFAGWLFSLGFIKFTFWQGVLAIVIWPWYLGRALRVL